MNKILSIESSNLYNDSCMTLLNNTKKNSVSTIIADWPFAIYKTMYQSVITQATTCLNNGGNFVSVLYPEDQYYIRQKCEEEGLMFRDEIFLKRKMSYQLNSKTLAKRALSIMLFSKGPLVDRHWNGTNSLVRIIDAESMGILTDVWDEIQFRNGFKQGKDKHPEAMPIKTVDKLIELLCIENDNVLDLFCGAGTVLLSCHNHKVNCQATEISPKNCEIIKNRLDKNKILIELAQTLIAKTEDGQHNITNQQRGLLGRNIPEEGYQQISEEQD